MVFPESVFALDAGHNLELATGDADETAKRRAAMYRKHRLARGDQIAIRIVDRMVFEGFRFYAFSG